MTSSAIEAFRIEVPQAEVDGLIERIRRTRWPDEVPGCGWERGVPLGYLKELATYWATKYSWRAEEANLNRFPQFTTSISGQRLHFVHARSERTNAPALLLLHGWPGSIVEFLDAIAPLVRDFHVVVPSLPGHGFSGPITEAGWTDRRIAAAMLELMNRLGYERFLAQGGDISAFIAPEMGRLAPERLLGIHVNALVTFPTNDPADFAALTDGERARLEQAKRFREEGFAYAQIQGTRPQTISYGLTDSPVAQLAWIVEKFKEWTDPQALLPEEAVDRDRLLTNVSIYWLTRTARSSASVYYERFHDPSMWAPKTRSGVPTGVAVFPNDYSIRRFAEKVHNVVHWSEFDRGGHFAAFEQPELFAQDLRTFCEQVRPR